MEDQELTLTCLHAPFFLSTEDVNARLRAVVNESLKSMFEIVIQPHVHICALESEMWLLPLLVHS